MASPFTPFPTISTSHISLTSPSQPSSLLTILNPFPVERRRKSRRFTIKSSHKPTLNTHILAPNFCSNKTALKPFGASKPPQQGENSPISTLSFAEFRGSVFRYIAKPVVFALFCVAVEFCPIGKVRVCAIAAPVAEVAMNERGRGREKGKDSERASLKGHEYSDRTRRLLDTVSRLVRIIEEVRKNNGDMEGVEKAFNEVKLKRVELKEEILGGLHAELKVLRREKMELVKLSDGIVDSVARAKREAVSSGKGDGNEARERLSKLEESMRGSDKEYAEMWEKIGNIEDQILSKETMALSVGMMELNFIEQECVQLVEGFRREMRQRNIER